MSLNDILQIDRERVRRERVVIKTIYDRMKNRINISAKARSQTCIYTIPEFIPGYPLVNTSKTMNYLIKKLQKEGFMAVQIDYRNLYVAWDPQSIRDLDSRQRNMTTSDPVVKSTHERDADLVDSMVRAKHKDRF